jgi:hypothetical protein
LIRGIECDSTIENFDLQQNDGTTKKVETKIAIEMNGTYHYPRNSESQLGKQSIKASLLKK